MTRNNKNNRIPKVIVMLGFVSLFTDIATEMIYPLVPVFVAALGSGAILLGVIEGVAETTSSLLNMASGIVSDKIRKRKLLVLIGYTLSSIVRPLTGLVTSAWEIVFVRMIDRVGKGIRSSPRDAMIASSADESIRGRAYGFHQAMDHVGAVLGPVLAITTLLILFLAFGLKDSTTALRWTFMLAIIPGLLAVLTILFFVKESADNVKKKEMSQLKAGSLDKNFRNYLAVMVLFTLGNSSDAFLLFRVQEAIHKSGAVTDFVNQFRPFHNLIAGFGDSATQSNVVNILFLPLVWAFFHIIKVAFSTPLGALSDRIGRKIVINSGWAIYSFVYFAFALLVFLSPGLQILATFVLFAIYALFYAFTEGAGKAFVADLVPEEKRGTAFGLYNLSIGLGALPASLMFGFIYSFVERRFQGFGGTAAFSFGGLLALISMILLWLKVKELEKAL
jgi:MFS family permease